MAVIVPLHRKKPKRRRAKLTDPVVRAMHEGERIYDGIIGGLYAQRGKRGITFRIIADLPTRAWKQRLDGPQTLERSIGDFPNMSAKRARIEGARVIALIKSGTDPNEPERGPLGPTLREAWRDYKTDYMVKRGRSPKTVLFYEFCFARLKHWHDKPLGVIAANPDALAKEHARLTRTHRRKNSDGNGAADGTIGFLKLVYNHACGKATHLPSWPAKAVVMHGPRSRAHLGMGTKDLAVWWRKAEHLEPIKRQFVLFLLLSGLRGEDAMTARWEHVDEQNRTLFIPRPKGGSKRAFKLPLSNAMLACLHEVDNAWRQGGRERNAWLFPSVRSERGHIADARASYTDDDGKEHYVPTGHSLRHSFINCALEAGCGEPVVAALVNHKARTITARYHDPNATPAFYLEMMERISRRVMEALRL
jgi:integrase